jgi:hypothetical protein
LAALPKERRGRGKSRAPLWGNMRYLSPKIGVIGSIIVIIMLSCVSNMTCYYLAVMLTRGSTSSGSDEERSPSPPRRSHQSKGAREKATVKVKTEDPESRRMMKSIKESLEAIKVNLAENRKPRRTIPTSRMNVWCARCGDPGHYASECQRLAPKWIHYVNPEEEVFMLYRKKKRRRHLRSTRYNLRTDKKRYPSFRFD